MVDKLMVWPRPSSFQFTATVILMPMALPKFVPPTGSRVAVATPLSSFLVTSAFHGVITFVPVLVVMPIVVDTVVAPNVVYSELNDSLSKVSMMSCARAVASVIVLPPLSWRPPMMNIEQIDRSTPARTPIAITTSIRLNPVSPDCPDLHGLRAIMTLSSSLEGAVGARDRAGRRDRDGVPVVARSADEHAERNRLVAGGAGRAVDVEGDRRGAGGLDGDARLDQHRDRIPFEVGVGVLVRRCAHGVVDRHGARSPRRHRVVAQGPEVRGDVVGDASHLVGPERVGHGGPAEEDEQPDEGDHDEELGERVPSVVARVLCSCGYRLHVRLSRSAERASNVPRSGSPMRRRDVMHLRELSGVTGKRPRLRNRSRAG